MAEGRTKTTDPTYKHRHAHPSRLKRRQGEEKIQLELVKKKRSMDDAVGLRQQKVTIVEDEAVRKAFKLNKKIKDREEAEVSMKEVNDKMTGMEAKCRFIHLISYLKCTTCPPICSIGSKSNVR